MCAKAQTLGYEVRGTVYYPPGGGIGWHTNSDDSGWRLYAVRVPPEAKSFLKTADAVYFDRLGYVNLFKIEAPPALSWHCVGAPTERWSVGLRIPDALASEILAAAGQSPEAGGGEPEAERQADPAGGAVGGDADGVADVPLGQLAEVGGETR